MSLFHSIFKNTLYFQCFLKYTKSDFQENPMEPSNIGMVMQNDFKEKDKI
jgi:hypothetical protein